MANAIVVHGLGRGALVAAGLVLQAATVPAWAGGATQRVSLGLHGAQANGDSYLGGISDNGRFVTFDSYASNLVRGDINHQGDSFIVDRQTGVTERISLGPHGEQGNDVSYSSRPSSDGRYVAFGSLATNLSLGDTGGFSQIYLRDRVAGTTRLVSKSPGGQPGNNYSYALAMSADGRIVVFTSDAANLVPDDTNGVEDTFAYARETDRVTRVSLSSSGQQANSRSIDDVGISSGGRFVVFTSDASNLVEGKTNVWDDVFLRDLLTGTTQRVSVGPGGRQGNNLSYAGAVSNDGRYVAFGSQATNLVQGEIESAVDVYLRDRLAAVTVQVSVGPKWQKPEANTESGVPFISDDGRYVAFWSYSDQLARHDSNQRRDILLRDTKRGRTELVSLGADGRQGNEDSFDCAISGDGRVVAFDSKASNLVPGDTNHFQDVFVRLR